MTGCHKLQVDSIDKFKKTLPALDTGFMDRGEFSDFYKVCVFYVRFICHVAVFEQLLIRLLWTLS